MAGLSLKDALLMFQQGARDFGFAQNINKINQQVQLIRNEQEKGLIDEAAAQQRIAQQAQQAALAGAASGKAAEGKLAFGALQPASKEGLAGKDLQNAVIKSLDTFDRRKDVAALRETTGLVERMRAKLRVTDRAGFNSAVKELIRTTDQRITDQDFKLGLPRLDVKERLEASLKSFFAGEATEAEKEVILQIASELETGARNAWAKKAKGYAKGRAQVLGVSPSTLEGLINDSLGTSNVQQGSLDQQLREEDKTSVQFDFKRKGYMRSR